eukprot:g554.t1
MQMHPDKLVSQNLTEEEIKDISAKFVEIVLAYEILGDEVKRAHYDQHGAFSEHEYQKATVREYQHKPFDLYATFKTRGEFRFHWKPPYHPDGEVPDVKAKVEVTLQELEKGSPRNETVTVTRPCKHCNGTGAHGGRKSKHYKTCPYCSGTGFHSYFNDEKEEEHHHHHIGKGDRAWHYQHMVNTTCSRCNGKGYTIDRPCKFCGGLGHLEHQKSYYFHTPPSCKPGRTIEFVPDANSDVREKVVFTIVLIPDPVFQLSVDPKKCGELHVNFNVTLVESLLGFKRKLTGFNGGDLRIKKKYVVDGMADTFVQQGLLNPETKRRADLILSYTVIWPTALTLKERKRLKMFLSDDAMKLIDGLVALQFQRELEQYFQVEKFHTRFCSVNNDYCILDTLYAAGLLQCKLYNDNNT